LRSARRLTYRPYPSKGAANEFNSRRPWLQDCITYFGNHLHQMRYARYVENAIPTGSGVTEAVRKTLVKQRLVLRISVTAEVGLRGPDCECGIIITNKAPITTPGSVRTRLVPSSRVAEITQGKNKYDPKGAWEKISAATCATARYLDGVEQ
jgi:hypothetical protein